MKFSATRISIVGLAVAASHSLPAFWQVFPETDLQRQQEFLVALWGIQAALFGALLVATFFVAGLLTGNRRVSPAIAQAILASLGSSWAVALFVGGLAGVSLQLLMLLPAPPGFPVVEQGLGGFVFISFPIFVLALVTVGITTARGIVLLGTDKRSASALHFVRQLADRVERNRLAERARSSVEFAKRMEQVRARGGGTVTAERSPLKSLMARVDPRWRQRREDAERLGEIVDDAQEDAVEALGNGDTRALRDAGGMLRSVWSSYVALHSQRGMAFLDYELRGDEPPMAWWVRRAVLSTFEVVPARSGPSITAWLAGFPINLTSLAQQSSCFTAYRTGLDLVFHTRAEFRKVGAADCLDLWELNWAEHPTAPLPTLRRLARGLREPTATDDDCVAVMNLAAAVERALLESATRACLQSEYDEARRLVANLRDSFDLLGWLCTGSIDHTALKDEARSAVSDHDLWRVQSFFTFMGLVAIHAHVQQEVPPLPNAWPHLDDLLYGNEEQSLAAFATSRFDSYSKGWFLTSSASIAEMLPLHLDRDAWVLHWDEPVLLGFCAYLETLSPEQQQTLVNATRRLKVPLAELEAISQRVARCAEPWPTLGGTAPRAAEFIASVRRVE